MANEKVYLHTAVHNAETGESLTLAPGDKLPSWAKKSDLNPELFKAPEGFEHEDFPVAGPGQTLQALDEDDLEILRKGREARRKRESRAAQSAEERKAADEADLKAAQEAEAEAERERLAAAQGGGS